MERLLHMRNWGRTRSVDETVIPYLARPEGSANPFTGRQEGADPERFRRLMDEFYDLRGWDRKTGWPMRGTLERLGIGHAVDELAERDKLPEEERP